MSEGANPGESKHNVANGMIVEVVDRDALFISEVSEATSESVSGRAKRVVHGEKKLIVMSLDFVVGKSGGLIVDKVREGVVIDC